MLHDPGISESAGACETSTESLVRTSLRAVLQQAARLQDLHLPLLEGVVAEGANLP